MYGLVLQCEGSNEIQFHPVSRFRAIPRAFSLWREQRQKRRFHSFDLYSMENHAAIRPQEPCTDVVDEYNRLYLEEKRWTATKDDWSPFATAFRNASAERMLIHECLPIDSIMAGNMVHWLCQVRGNCAAAAEFLLRDADGERWRYYHAQQGTNPALIAISIAERELAKAIAECSLLPGWAIGKVLDRRSFEIICSIVMRLELLKRCLSEMKEEASVPPEDRKQQESYSFSSVVESCR